MWQSQLTMQGQQQLTWMISLLLPEGGICPQPSERDGVGSLPPLTVSGLSCQPHSPLGREWVLLCQGWHENSLPCLALGQHHTLLVQPPAPAVKRGLVSFEQYEWVELEPSLPSTPVNNPQENVIVTKTVAV